MEGILAAHKALEQKGNLDKAVEDVQKLIDQLQAARDAISDNPSSAPIQIAKLKTPAKQSFDKIEDDLKEVNKGLNQYSKALKDKFKNAALPTAPNDVLSSQPDLINRAIAMHLLREGKFEVARAFVQEVNAAHTSSSQKEGGVVLDRESKRKWMRDFSNPDISMDDGNENEVAESLGSGQLYKEFTDMYLILEALRKRHDLAPAIDWARAHGTDLDMRGSNLEFELARLRFVELYQSEDAMDVEQTEQTQLALRSALEYARQTFHSFGSRYSRDIASLLGSLAYADRLEDSPYKNLFYNQDAWEEVSQSFTREFCGMLGLSSQSPLYTAVTAGGIALPILEKVERVMAQARGQWTSVNELPVETPLPPSMLFHSVFVCPVSKEQATDANPPMMMTCGHVIAKESLEAHSRGKARMKCPYCPNESEPKNAKRIYL